MNKFRLIAMMILVATPATLYAADFGAFGSYWDTDEGGSSIGFGGIINFDSLPLEVGASLYPDLSIKGAGDAMVIPIDLGLSVNLSRAESFDIYVGGGGSYVFIDADNSNPDNQVGWYSMVRLEIPFSDGFNLFGEAMYRGVEFEDINTDLSGPIFAVGVTFR